MADRPAELILFGVFFVAMGVFFLWLMRKCPYLDKTANKMGDAPPKEKVKKTKEELLVPV